MLYLRACVLYLRMRRLYITVQVFRQEMLLRASLCNIVLNQIVLHLNIANLPVNSATPKTAGNKVINEINILCYVRCLAAAKIPK